MQRTFDMVSALKHSDKWLVLDNHYSEESSVWLRENIGKYGYILFDEGYNMGLHRGYNRLLEEVKTTHMLAVDPDVLPATRYFDLELLKHAENMANVWVSCFNTVSLSQFAGHELEGELIINPRPVVNSICLFACGWLRSVGGMQEPTALYGGLESHMWQYLDQKTMRWVFALNSIELRSDVLPDLSDAVYHEFKVAHGVYNDQRTWEEFRRDYDVSVNNK
jgi:hypothetical protein